MTANTNQDSNSVVTHLPYAIEHTGLLRVKKNGRIALNKRRCANVIIRVSTLASKYEYSMSPSAYADLHAPSRPAPLPLMRSSSARPPRIKGCTYTGRDVRRRATHYIL